VGYLWFRFRLWRRETGERIRWRVAWLVPRSIALLCFVRVHSASGDAPGDEYSRAYRAFEKGAGR
jgi:hypothetical protein